MSLYNDSHSLVYKRLKQSLPEEEPIVGFTAGNFDLLHYGYIVTFEEAKRHCDKFIVFLHNDPSKDRPNKRTPVMPLYERYKTLMAIRFIDEVYTYQTEEELVRLLKILKPQVRILGEDYLGKSPTGSDLGFEVIYTTRTHGWSTTKIKNRITAMTAVDHPHVLMSLDKEEIKRGVFTSVDDKK